MPVGANDATPSTRTADATRVPSARSSTLPVGTAGVSFASTVAVNGAGCPLVVVPIGPVRTTPVAAGATVVVAGAENPDALLASPLYSAVNVHCPGARTWVHRVVAVPAATVTGADDQTRSVVRPWKTTLPVAPTGRLAVRVKGAPWTTVVGASTVTLLTLWTLCVAVPVEVRKPLLGTYTAVSAFAPSGSCPVHVATPSAIVPLPSAVPPLAKSTDPVGCACLTSPPLRTVAVRVTGVPGAELPAGVTWSSVALLCASTTRSSDPVLAVSPALGTYVARSG
jgi:hypothetical protein